MNIEEMVEYIKHHIPIIIQYENGGWSNAKIKIENGTLVVVPDYDVLFDD